MDERYYIEDLEKRILKAIKRATETAEICQLLNRGMEQGHADVSRTDVECRFAGIIEAAEIERLIDVYVDWFPDTPAAGEFRKQLESAGERQRQLQTELHEYIEWLKSRPALGT